MHKASEKEDNIIWIDSGNDEVSGQMVCWVKIKGEVLLPPVTVLFPDILEDNDTIFKSEESCGERVVSQPQDIATNIMAGQLVFSFLNNLLTRKELTVHMTTFNAETMVSRPRYIDDYLNVPISA